MANINIHTRMHIIDDKGNNITLYPTTTASDVSLNKTINNTTYNDLNTLVNALTSNAFSSSPSVMTGATSSSNGTSGLVPQPISGSQNKVLTGSATYADAGELAFDSSKYTAHSLTGSINFNNITTAGVYYCEYSSSNFTNAPSSNNTILVVFTGKNNYYIRQIAYLVSYSTYYYMRYRTNGSWSSWYQYYYSNTYLKGISNNLNYSTSNTTQALSAYQGYVLNNKLGDQVTYSLSGTTLNITTKS